ncbi:hypothetical protein CSA17_05770 [bacterium DOLJORAL78_65_58]|nr:MAG: hypothetical protein CSB20_03705 [bacterium DOLZORAL124_64_63]PIE75761.1 MAG: hypothetical protein CSA17_05770 [bacterium DOLJORAL78_65_58]
MEDHTPRKTDAPILVRKYGGSSLADVERIRTVARDLVACRREGHRLVVVVSAMGSTTNELEAMARQASARPARRELDMLLSVGERITMSLLCMVLEDEGCPAISFTGSQVGIITDTSHTDARILRVTAQRVRAALAQDRVVVVAGFQGVSEEKEITTLGRGGSDTTAVALAAALGAQRCEILKDVDGILSADPKAVPEAWLHRRLSYAELRDIAATGCGVVHIRAVEYAEKHGVPLQVRSSFHNRPGTSVGPAGELPLAATAAVGSDRQNRFRPLAMTIAKDVTRLNLSTTRLETARRWREEILCRVEPCGVLAEWLDHGRHNMRWEVLAPRPILQDLLAVLAEKEDPELSIGREDGLTCYSFAGGRPDSWLEVQKHLDGIMADAGCRSWRLRVDGSALRVLVTQAEAPPVDDLGSCLHQALLQP